MIVVELNKMEEYIRKRTAELEQKRDACPQSGLFTDSKRNEYEARLNELRLIKLEMRLRADTADYLAWLEKNEDKDSATRLSKRLKRFLDDETD